jgi:3-hydroxyisobutyrate dehydrogenase/2-hydroxy-3-oxopropionate reductase
MAGRLLDAGHEVVVWNRTAAKAGPLLDRGATVAASPRAAAGGVEATIVMVSDPAALVEVTEGPEGVLAGLASFASGAAGRLLVQASTVGPSAAARLAERMPDGVDLLDAPVLGSIAEAEAGELRVFAGGGRAVFERWRPLLAVLGSPMLVGPVGAGQAAKLVANSTLFAVLGALGEALALGHHLGLPREIVFEVLAATPLAAQAERRRPAIESGDYPSRFALSMARKDADLIAQAAEGSGLRLAEAARRWLADAETGEHGDQDYASLLAHIVETAG